MRLFPSPSARRCRDGVAAPGAHLLLLGRAGGAHAGKPFLSALGLDLLNKLLICEHPLPLPPPCPRRPRRQLLRAATTSALGPNFGLGLEARWCGDVEIA